MTPVQAVHYLAELDVIVVIGQVGPLPFAKYSVNGGVSWVNSAAGSSLADHPLACASDRAVYAFPIASGETHMRVTIDGIDYTHRAPFPSHLNGVGSVKVPKFLRSTELGVGAFFFSDSDGAIHRSALVGL